MKNSLFATIALSMVTAVTLTAQTANRSKMSPMLADIMTDQATATARGMSHHEENYILTLVKLTDDDTNVLTAQGCKVIDRVGHICIALLPVSRLDELSLDERVVQMEAHALSRPMLDVTHQALNTSAIYNGMQLPQAYTGKGVVVGICDIGFDFTHPIFQDANGQSRIREAWDIYTGKNSGYKGVGTLYNTPEALAAARGSSDSLQQYHGTHVAAIAAGSNAAGSRYSGIACESDIVLSQTLLTGYTTDQYKRLVTSLNQTLKNHTADPLIQDVANKKLTLTNVMEALAIKHVMDYATEHQQPCVVNCSFGSNMKLTEDYTLMEELMNSLTGPGRIIVCSAGNNGDGILYRKYSGAEKRWDDHLWLRSTLTPTITLRSAGDFMIKVLPDIEGADTLCISSEKVLQAEGMTLTDSARVNGAQQQSWYYFTAKAYTSSSPQMPLTSYSVKLTLPTDTKAYRSAALAFVVESSGEVEVMGSWNAATFSRVWSGTDIANAPYTVGTPAIFSEMIAVGLTSHRDSITNIDGERQTYEYNNNALGQVVSWSSAGPTLDGRMKPDVVAPGHNIISAVNGYYPIDNLSDKNKKLLVGQDTYNGQSYYWIIESGSSMSAPVVTGVIALWLQANPQLTPDDIKQLLSQTARHPEPDDTYPNYRYGYGEIDAYKGLLQLTNLMGVEGLSDYQPQEVNIRLLGRRLILTSSSTHPASPLVTVYNLSGQVVMHAYPTDGTVDLSQLPTGVYAVQVDTNQPTTTGSSLIRLQ